METKRKKIIVIESQLNLREVIVFSLESHFNIEAVRLDTYEEVYEELQNKNNEVSFIFCGNTVLPEDKTKIYNLFIINRLHTKMNFYDFSDHATPLEFNSNKRAIKIPRSTHIDTFINQMEKDFEINMLVPSEDYTPVSIDSFSFLDEMKHCVYIKLISGRYLKLFQKDDIINEFDIIKYKSKGVNWLHLKKEAFSWIKKQIADQYKNVLSNPNKSVKLEMTSKLEESEEVISTLMENKPFDFDPEIMNELPDKINNIKNKLKKNLTLKDLVSGVLQNKKLEHFIENRTNLVIYFSCAIAKELDWKSEQISDKLIYCAMTHDILLYNYPKILIYDALGKLDSHHNLLKKEELDLYENHPILTASLVEKDSNAPKDACVIIAQHHEKTDGSGFPNKIDNKRMNALSMVFNLSLDLANKFMNNSNFNWEQYIRDQKMTGKGANYKKSLVALERILSKNNI